MSINNPLDRQLLDMLYWFLELEEVRDILVSQEERFLKTMLKNMQPREEKSDFIF